MSAEMMDVFVEGYVGGYEFEDPTEQDWKEIIGAYQNKKILHAELQGIETKLNKPCGVILVGNIRGVIPLEFSGCENLQQMRKLVGQKIAFMVHSYDMEDDGAFTGSRLAAREFMANNTWKKFEEGKIKEGAIIPAVAQDVNPYRVAADIGGIRVNIPIEEIDYGWIDDLTEKVKAGEPLRVVVQKVDLEKKEIKVSAKAAKKNPWPDCTRRYFVGSEYAATVSGVADYGIFTNLEPGVDVLSNHLKFEGVKRGEKVLVRILKIDVQKNEIRGKIVKRL